MEKTIPLVSVIIPTYNRGWIVQKAIDSVLDQSFSDFELIVVDDGSTDNSKNILHAYGDKITVIAQQNKGVSAARNRGINVARGEYIAFLDSDDTWFPEKLSVQTRFFNKHPDSRICQTEEIWIRNHKRVNPGKRHKKYSGMIFENSLALCLISPSAVMMQKSLFETVGLFDESLPACEDYDLWLRITCRVPVHLIDTPLIIKNGGHKDQLSRMPQLDKYRIQSLVNILNSKLLSQTQYKAALNMLKNKCRIYANGCLKRGRKDEAEYYLALPDSFS